MSIGSFFSGLFGNNPAQQYQAQDPYVMAGNTPNSALGQALIQQQQTYQQQQALAAQLQQQAAGQGPSPSQTMLAQALSQSGANANGLVAANRGHYSGMALRDALQANNQATQAAAGTGVAARQQEMRTAQGELGGLYANQGAQGLQQQQLLSNASLGSQAINANLQTAGAAANGQSAGSALGAIGSVGSFLSKPGSTGTPGTVSPTDGGTMTPTSVGPSTGGVTSTDIGGGVGSSYPATESYARGGIVPRRPPQMLAAGGVAANPYDSLVSSYTGLAPGIASAGLPPIATGGGSSGGGIPGLPGMGSLPGMDGGGLGGALGLVGSLGGALAGYFQGKTEPTPTTTAPQGTIGPGGGATTNDPSHGSGPGGSNAPSGGNYARGGSIQAGSRLQAGGNVPGKAKVAGDSYANDTVDAKLSPGEIVIDREHSKNAKLAKDFIDELMSQKKKKAEGAGGFGAVLQAHRKLGAALAAAGVK